MVHNALPRVAVVLVAALFGVLAWRVQVQEAERRGPVGSSATVEGVETVVSPKVPGRLVELTAYEGDRVKGGQVVGRLDCLDQDAALLSAVAREKASATEVAVAEAALASAGRNVAVARAQVAAAEAQKGVVAVERETSDRDRKRADQLAQTGAIPNVELEHTSLRLQGIERQADVVTANVQVAASSSSAAQSAVGTAKAQVEAARASAEAARAERHRAEVAVAECTLLAPRDGVVTHRLLEPGAVVSPGTRVLELVDLTTAKVTFFVPNRELAKVTLGATADVRVDTYPGRVFEGKVRRISSEAEFTPRNVQTREDRDRLVYAVEVHVPNAEGLLQAGMPAEVALRSVRP